MDNTMNSNNEPFGQKITLSCRCTVPKWTLIGDNLICDKCKTTINVNYQLKNLIQAQETSAVPENYDENLSRILEVLMDIRNEIISAKQVVEENKQLRSTLEKKEAQ